MARTYPRGDPRHRGLDRHHRGVPGRDRGRLRADPRSGARRLGSTAPTRSSTRQGPAPSAAGLDEQVPKHVVQERFDRLVALQERISTAKAAALRWAGRSRCSSRAAIASGRSTQVPNAYEPHRAHHRRPRPGSVRRSSHRRRGAAPPHGRARARAGRLGALTARSMATRPPLLALVGPTASGKTEAGIGLARIARRRDLLGRLDARLPWHGHRHRQAAPPSSARWCPITCIDVAEPSERFTVARFQRLARDRDRGCSQGRSDAPARRRIRPVLPSAWSTGSSSPRKTLR